MTSRVVIFSGKGGTGKTTISAATAALAARQGQQVLVISSDPAHSLSDVVCAPIDRTEPTRLTENLYALELDAVLEAQRSMSGLQEYMEDKYQARGVTPSVAAELAGQPGLDEILALNRLMEEAQSGRWDAVIVDTAPTGNTLRLLAYPEMIVGGRQGQSFLKAYQGVAGLIRNFKASTPDDRFFNEVNRLIDIMRGLSRFILSEPVSLRLVMNAEKLSVQETKRAYTFLSLYGVALDAVMLNKLLPYDIALPGLNTKASGAALGPYFDYWIGSQQRYIIETENSFAPLPILKTYLQRSEPLGVPALADLGAIIYGQLPPLGHLHQQRTVWLEDFPNRTGEIFNRRLCLRIPFMDEADEVEVEREGSEITISFGRLQRQVALPRILNDATLTGCLYEDDTLKLSFSS